MATQSDTARYIAIGMRHRGPYLIQQAGYTLGLAALVGPALAGKVPPNFLERTAALRSELEKSLEDKTLRTAESRQATSTQNQCRHDAKIWIRQSGRRCLSAMQLGVELPPELGTVSSPPTVPGMLEQMSKTLSLLEKHAADMEKIGLPVQELIAAGRALHQALQAADSAQERARAADLPAATAAFCAKKGELYTMLKVINNAGHELFADNPAEAGRFNMSILHRHAPPAAAADAIPATPTAPTPAPAAS